MRIVDPETRTECPEATTGEIWVHGDNVAVGYWGKPEETERTFGGMIVTPSTGTPEGPWLRTGDLGFLSEGELFIVGRIKDLLIVYGRNHAPEDIEATIQDITRGRVRRSPFASRARTARRRHRGQGEATPTRTRCTSSPLVERQVTAAISNTHAIGVADRRRRPPVRFPSPPAADPEIRLCRAVPAE